MSADSPLFAPGLVPAVAPAPITEEFAPVVVTATAQEDASLAVLTQVVLLAAALIVGRVLERAKVTWLSEAGAALLLGLAVGVAVHFAAVSETYSSWIAFKKEFFFIALLPPIIFEAGFSLQVQPFVRNVGAISCFAFAGTCISTIAVGVTMYLGGLVHLCIRLTLLEALLFGAIISATDPVSVLAVFQRLKADENLYALVFGESVLNDAVAIVLYTTIGKFLYVPITLAALGSGLMTFIWVFVGSMLAGMSMGFFASLFFKTQWFRIENSPLEACLVIMFAFSSYLIADGCGLSGILAVLFCGMIMANYTRPNLSPYSQQTTEAFVKIWATMAETFVFVYIGASLLLEEGGGGARGKGFTWAFLVVALIALAWSRAANIYLCAKMVNVLRPVEMHIPKNHCYMLWWSGLRGAIAFALSLNAAEDLADGKGRVLLICTFYIILLTVLVNGGACTYVLQRLRLMADDNINVSKYRRLHLSNGLGDDTESRSTSTGSTPHGVPAAIPQVFGAHPPVAELTILQRRPSATEDEEVTTPTEMYITPQGPSRGGTDLFGNPRRVPSMGAPQPSGETRISPSASGGNVGRAAGVAPHSSQDAHGAGQPSTLLDIAMTSAGDALHSTLEKVRELNRNGIMDTLTQLDERYLQKMFVADPSDIEAATQQAHDQGGVSGNTRTDHRTTPPRERAASPLRHAPSRRDAATDPPLPEHTFELE